MVEPTNQLENTTLNGANRDLRTLYSTERIEQSQVFLMRHAKSSLNESMTDFRSQKKVDCTEDKAEKGVVNDYLDLIFD